MSQPEWVSEQLFEKALKSYLEDKDIEILKYTLSEAVPVGDNYTSDLFRMTITHVNKHKNNPEKTSIIVKCFPISREDTLQFVQQTRLFEKESEMYRDTLPKIHAILGELWTLSARYVYYTENPYKIIMFEDLAPSNFKMADRREGLDLEHCLIIVEKMANLHAASVILAEQDPNIFKNYEEGLFSKTDLGEKWIKISVESVSKMCLTCPGFEKYGSKLDAMKDTIVEKGITISEKRDGDFNVLNHGDCWINNFMFQYTPQGKLKDFKFVDYQLVIYSSPAIDLQYFWATSPNIEVRKEHLCTILDRYYACLLSTFTKLQYPVDKVPTRKQFREKWNEKAIYGLLGALTVLPLVKSSSRNDASFENLFESDDQNSFRHHAYNNENYKKHMQIILPFLDDLGVLDY